MELKTKKVLWLVAMFTAAILIFNGIFNCWPLFSKKNIEWEPLNYSQDFKTEAALFVQEDNLLGWPLGLGSTFLIDKQKGEFGTAAHCLIPLGDVRFVLFHNGKIYECAVSRESFLLDVATVKIKDYFNPSVLGEPLKFGVAKVGEEVRIKAFHRHFVGKGWPAIGEPVKGINKYYQDFQKLLPSGMINGNEEVVFESFEAVVADVHCLNGSSIIPAIMLKLKQDHIFTILGLSGAMVVNALNELVGIIVTFPTKGGWVRNPLTQKEEYVPYDIVFAVPAAALKQLVVYSQ